MNPWEVVNKILKGELLTEDDMACPTFLILRILSFDKQLLMKIDELNYFLPLTNEQWYKVIISCVGGLGHRWIGYVKKETEKEHKVFEKFKDRVKSLYSWSEREFGMHLMLLSKVMNNRFLFGLGMTSEEQTSLVKFLSG